MIVSLVISSFFISYNVTILIWRGFWLVSLLRKLITHVFFFRIKRNPYIGKSIVENVFLVDKYSMCSFSLDSTQKAKVWCTYNKQTLATSRFVNTPASTSILMESWIISRSSWNTDLISRNMKEYIHIYLYSKVGSIHFPCYSFHCYAATST